MQPTASSTLALMAVSAGIAAANLYYAQPLLPRVAADFGVDGATVSLLPAITQMGFALGIVSIVPLIDIVERRGLLLTILVLMSAALLLLASAPNLDVLFVACFGIGLVGITPQLLAPFAAILAPRGREGAAVGTVLSGVMSGIVLSRIFAGAIAEWFGWRTVFFVASAGALCVALLLRMKLPVSEPKLKMGYRALITSSFALLVAERRLWRHVVYGALTFACFMTFWSTYAMHVETAFELGTAAAGLFGLAGLAGIVCASLAGRQIDRGHFTRVCVAGATLMLAGFACLALFRQSLAGIAVGAVLLDAGATISHAANQSEALRLRPEAIARINSVYISGYFLGGAIGTVMAGVAYSRAGWVGVCAVGGCLSSLLLVSELRTWISVPAAEAK
jgi:predicted MFS family arabinose efflux permease